MKKTLLILSVAMAVSACTDDNTHTISDKSIANHPLKAYLVPHGVPTLDYFGEFWRSCDPEKWIAKEICDKEVKRAIEIGKKRGIKLTRDDLVNRHFWKKHLGMRKMKKTLFLDFLKTKPDMLQKNQYRKEFRAKENQLLKSVGGGK